MDNLQSLVEGYLESANFNILDTREGFLAVDKLEFGGDRDTRLFWILPPPVHVVDFRQLERRLLRELEAMVPQYPNPRCSIIAYTREGLSPDFRSELTKLRVRLRVHIEFFDTPFRWEEARDVGSAMLALKDPETLRKRIPQPYSTLIDGEPQGHGRDLLPDLFEELNNAKGPCLRVVVGAAGAGKSVLFKALFSRTYDHFQEQKSRRKIFPRPIPFTPEYLREASALRTEALIDSFLKTELAAPASRKTFEWMLVHGLNMWLFDGLDELYAGDPKLFEYLLNLMTLPESRAQVLICARNSLLTTCDTFIDFLDEFPPGLSDVRFHRLDDWDYDSKRTFAWVSLEDHLPATDEADSTRVSEFLRAISQSDSLKSLSGLPYYCSLLVDQFKEGQLLDFSNDFSLVEGAISGIVDREIAKELLSHDQFIPDGLEEWLETIGSEFYLGDFAGFSKMDVEEYAGMVLRQDPSTDEGRKAVTQLTQFPLFAPGIKTGVITFKHELTGEYLAGRYFLKRIVKDAAWVARALGTRIDLADSLVLRYIASKLAGQKEAMQAAVDTLKTEPLPGRAFANLLQLVLLATPARDVIRANGIQLEGRDLKYVQFRDKDLQNVSFRNCELLNATLRGCDLRNALFEGAFLSGTRFEELTNESLRGARFGNLERFEFIYVGKQRIQEVRKMIEWVQKTTGLTQRIQEPCPAALQLRVLFLKFVCPDGSGRRNELREEALSRGKRYPSAPSPEDCVRASIRFGYLQGPDWRKRVRRAPGDRYNDIVYFIRDRRLSTEMRQLLNSLCKKSGCQHVVGSA